MPILLCAATEMEIAPTIKFLLAQNLPIEVLITGVGLPASMYALTKCVCTFRPEYMLQAGIAGCCNPHLTLGEVVVVESDTIGDVGVEEKEGFRSLFDMGFADKNKSPWYAGKLTNNSKEYRHAGLPVVDAVTVNEISTNPKRIDYYHKNLGASIETMEGAALHYVGLMENIPFMQVRSLSNFAGERDKTKWEMESAITNLNRELQGLIKNYFER
ncbi:MAG: futalosine hydrolase [Bacteroidota bacterium]|nr:futalosine hydrolase [Bacteroidota bacterium]